MAGDLKATAMRLNANGSLDNQFGTLGKQIFDFGLTSPSVQVLHGVAFQGTQIIVRGAARVPGMSAVDDFVSRLQNDLIFADGFQ